MLSASDSSSIVAMAVEMAEPQHFWREAFAQLLVILMDVANSEAALESSSDSVGTKLFW
jgi:hypothetical protein